MSHNAKISSTLTPLVWKTLRIFRLPTSNQIVFLLPISKQSQSSYNVRSLEEQQRESLFHMIRWARRGKIVKETFFCQFNHKSTRIKLIRTKISIEERDTQPSPEIADDLTRIRLLHLTSRGNETEDRGARVVRDSPRDRHRSWIGVPHERAIRERDLLFQRLRRVVLQK